MLILVFIKIEWILRKSFFSQFPTSSYVKLVMQLLLSMIFLPYNKLVDIEKETFIYIPMGTFSKLFTEPSTDHLTTAWVPSVLMLCFYTLLL